MPSDIIDNRESYLADAVRPLLGQSVGAHFAVGYFFLSGFKAIAGELEKVQELRLLIGNTSNRETIEQLAEGHAAREAIQAVQREGEFLNAQQRGGLVAESERSIRDRLQRLDQTDDDQALIELLVRLIAEERLKVRVYTRARLHAKAYLFDYPGDRFEHGVGIVGSSNLSLAGLRDNTELNVVVHGNANHEQLRAWFQRLWDEAEPFSDQLMNQLKASWALDTIRQAYSQLASHAAPTPDIQDQQTKLERLRKLWSVTPLDGRVEFALRGLRLQKPALAEAISRLESLAFEHKLDVLADRHAEKHTLATEPVIICTEALV